MLNLNDIEIELCRKLTILAFERTKPFCYSCYKIAPTGTCETCHSDDMMRHLDGVGVEYGTDWVIKHILEEELEPIDAAESFEQSLDGCYPETTQIGFITYDTISAMKELDPVTFKMAQDEHLDSERENEQCVSFDNGSTFYYTYDVEKLVDHL